MFFISFVGIWAWLIIVSKVLNDDEQNTSGTLYPVAFLPVVLTNLHCLFDRVPCSQCMVKFLAPTLNRPKIIFSLAMFTEVVQLLFRDGSCRIEFFSPFYILCYCRKLCVCCGHCQTRNSGYPESTRCAKLSQWSQVDIGLEYSTWLSPCKKFSFLG